MQTDAALCRRKLCCRVSITLRLASPRSFRSIRRVSRDAYNKVRCPRRSPPRGSSNYRLCAVSYVDCTRGRTLLHACSRDECFRLDTLVSPHRCARGRGSRPAAGVIPILFCCRACILKVYHERVPNSSNSWFAVSVGTLGKVCTWLLPSQVQIPWSTRYNLVHFSSLDYAPLYT